jgi:hypothetical protein
MVTSTHKLTDITVALMDRNPQMNNWINNFLNKADGQISAVAVSDPDNYISVPLEEDYPSGFGARFVGKGRSSKPTTGTPFSLKPDLVYYGGGAIQRKIDFVHKVAEDKSYLLSILAESNGTKRYFGLGGVLYELIHGSRLLCIDELETSLHPDLMKHFLQVFLMNAQNSQLLVTTHNVSLMENQDFIRKDALWFSEKQTNGAVRLYSAADFDTTVLRKDSNIINAYKAGKLGAKPNLGSPYLIEE